MGAYTLTIDAQGIVAVMNDFYRGQDSGAAWVIDLSAVFLVLTSVTGLELLIYLKKLRVADDAERRGRHAGDDDPRSRLGEPKNP